MFREMRRKNQALSAEACREILSRGSTGILAVQGDDGYPYTVPLNFVLDGDRIYFHCARQGHKLDAIRRSSKVSFCVVDRDQVLPEVFSTQFASVVVFGRARVVEDPEECHHGLVKLLEKYATAFMEAGQKEIRAEWDAVQVVAIEIEWLSGKTDKRSMEANG